MNRRWLWGLAVVVPLALFAVARRAAEQRPILIGAHAGARELKLSHDGTRLFSSGQVETRVWDTATRARIGRWTIPDFWTLPAPDGQRIVTARTRVVADSNGQTARTRLFGEIRDARTGAEIGAFTQIWAHPIGNQDALQDLRWSADGREIWTLTNSALRRFDARDGRLIQSVAYDATNGFSAWQLAPDGDFIVASDRQGVRFFDAATGKQTRIWPYDAPSGAAYSVDELVVAPGGQWLMTQGFRVRNKTAPLLFQRASDGHITWRVSDPGHHEFRGFSADGQLAIFLEWTPPDQTIHIVARHSATGRELWRRSAPLTQDAALSSDGRLVYSLELDGTLRRWNAPASK